VERILGEIKIAEESDERGEDATRIRAVDRVHRCAHLFPGGPCHEGQSLDCLRPISTAAPKYGHAAAVPEMRP